MSSFWVERANAEVFGAMDKLMIAVCTVPNREIAEELSKSVLQGRMAACVSQVGNIRSAYWWQGSIERNEEVLNLLQP